VRFGASSALVAIPTAGGPERIVTTAPSPALGRGMGGGCFDWLADGSALVYAGADGALWLQPFPGGAPTRLADHPDVGVVQAPSVAPDGSYVAYVVDQAQVWRCAVDGDASSERLDDGTADFCLDPSVSPDGGVVSWMAWNVPDMPWDGARIEHVEVGSGRRRTTVAAGALQQPRWTRDGREVAVRDDSGWLQPWIDGVPVTSDAFEHAGPTWGPGQRSYALSGDVASMAVARNERGFGRLCVVDLAHGGVRSVARGVHGQLSWSGDVLVALRSGARTPTQVVAYDTTDWTRTVLAVGPVLAWDTAELPEPEPFEVAVDGVPVHARRYVAGGGRTICWVHGGPTDQWQVEFMPRVAYWWGQGWDVVVPDPRGSTGHGRAYQQALRGGWGALDVDDTAAVIRHAHANGWSSPERTVMMGGSSGGLTALGVLGRHRGLCAAGVVLYPVTDLADLAARSHRFEAHSTLTLVGPLDDEQLYRDRSPLSYADQIDVPVLVMHGDEDPVVPLEQSLALVDRIREAGGTVELHVMEGEGHGFRRPDHRLAEYRLVSEFLRAHR
jgi:dipeptidyl aminopeptidase/acylaminoacyl peptidase